MNRETYTLIPPGLNWAEDETAKMTIIAEARVVLVSLGFKKFRKRRGSFESVVNEDELYLERRNKLEDAGWKCHHNDRTLGYVLGEPKWKQ